MNNNITITHILFSKNRVQFLLLCGIMIIFLLSPIFVFSDFLFSDAHIIYDCFNEFAWCAFPVDMDGDGDIDVVGSGTTGPLAVGWWENTDGSGNAWNLHIVQDDPYCVWDTRSIDVTDIDGDGDFDILGAERRQGWIVVWYNSGDGDTWVSQKLPDEYGNPNGWFLGAHSVHAVDIDSDGDLDVLGTAKKCNEIAWWENVSGDASEWGKKRVIVNDMANVTHANADDLDNDGDIDIIGASNQLNVVVWWENMGDAYSWNEHYIDNNYSGANNGWPVDIDMDGDVDIIGASVYDGMVWWENNGIASLWNKHVIDNDFLSGHIISTIDFDSDGDLDILSASNSLNQIALWINSDSNGFKWIKHIIDDNYVRAYYVHTADLDGDSDLDIVGANLGIINEGDIPTLAWWENTVNGGLEDCDGDELPDDVETMHDMVGPFEHSALVLTQQEYDDLELIAGSYGMTIYEYSGEYEIFTLPKEAMYKDFPSDTLDYIQCVDSYGNIAKLDINDLDSIYVYDMLRKSQDGKIASIKTQNLTFNLDRFSMRFFDLTSIDNNGYAKILYTSPEYDVSISVKINDFPSPLPIYTKNSHGALYMKGFHSFPYTQFQFCYLDLRCIVGNSSCSRMVDTSPYAYAEAVEFDQGVEILVYSDYTTKTLILTHYLDCSTDPCDDDTDNDGLIDGHGSGEDLNLDGRVDAGETDPRNLDSDGDGIQDGTEKGLTEPEGFDTDMSVFIPDADPSTTTDPQNPDSDGDGLQDGEEDLNKNGKHDEGESNADIFTVDIDIKPGSDPNCITNDGHGVIPVAILGSENYDVYQIDPYSISLEGMIIKVVGKVDKEKALAHYEDVNYDGLDDLVIQIEDRDGYFEPGVLPVSISGNFVLDDGTLFPLEGSDLLCITQ